MPALPPMTSLRRTALPLACALVLTACGSDDDASKAMPAEADPALTGALADQIMVDPDLAGQNEAGASGAIASQSGALPPDDNSPKAIAAARGDALMLLGGAAKAKHAPAARELAESGSTGAILTAAARAAAAPVSGGAKCADQVSYTAGWAAKLPAAFPIYPRGNVQEAAGTDNPGCKLRIINFTTPVALGEVVDFYYSRAIGAGFKPDYIRQGGDDVLGASKGAASFMIYARTLPTGRTEVDLITNG